MIWELGDVDRRSACPASAHPTFESETDEIRLCMRAAPDPVRGVNEARLLEAGPPNDGNPARDRSSDIFALILLLSVCNRISPRLCST